MPQPSVDVVLERRGRGYAVMMGEQMKQAGDDGDSFYRAVLLALGQTRGDEVASYDIQALRNDVADTLMPRLNSGLLRIWWQNRKRRTGLTPERYIERYIRSPGSWDEPLAQLLPVIVPSSATWRRLGGRRLVVDLAGHGRQADPTGKAPVVAIRASDLWNAFVKGDAAVFGPMQREVLRDKSLSISSLTRSARMTLDHPRDAIEMRAVPTDLTVVFAALTKVDAGKDQRDLVLLPSSTALVDSHASLPAIAVALASDAKSGTRTYTVTETGSGATVRFVFAAGVACPAIEVLDMLKRSADVKQAFLMTTLDQLMMTLNDIESAAPGARAPTERAAMARLWSDLSDELRRRVQAGFSGREGPAAVELDVVRELKNGADPARVALANDMLVAALELWQHRGDISRIPFAFWRTEMAHAMPVTGDGADFIHARARVQDSFTRWTAVRADLQHWLGDPAIAASPQLDAAARECLALALKRADEAGWTGPASQTEAAPHELRSRLANLHQAILQHRDSTPTERPKAIAAAFAHGAAQLCGAVEGGMAGDAGVVTIPAVPVVSVLWPQLVADTTRQVLHLDAQAERDEMIDLSLMTRRATLVSDHPGDILQLTRIPPGLEVRFDPAAPGSVGSDQRRLYILPGQEAFLGHFGPLPSIYVSLSKGEQAGWQVYTIFDIGLRVGCNFIFTGAVAAHARSVLTVLNQAADARWTAFRDLYSELSNNAQIGAWTPERRAVAATYWRALPGSIQQRVLAYYRSNTTLRDLLEDLDIGDALASGVGAASVAMARTVLMSALDYWDEHGELDDVADSFWDDAIAEAGSTQLSIAGFKVMLDTVLQANRQWQETAPLFDNMLQWLAQPVLQDDTGYQQLRQCVLRATQRAVGLPVEDSGDVLDSLAQITSAQARARLAQVKQAVELPDAPSMTPSRILPRLRKWMTRIGGAEPIIVDADADTLDESTIEESCRLAGMGVRAVTYRLDAALPATRIASLFAIGSALLVDGTLPFEMLDKSYDGNGDNDGQVWWRSCRFYGAWRYDAQRRSWRQALHEMNVEGSLVAQREAFDAWLNALLEDIASSQSLYFFSNDRQQIELSGSVSNILTPQSRFEQRTVHLVGAGGFLILPEQLRGTVTIDLSRLDAEAISPIGVEPMLMHELQSHTPVTIEGKTFLRYRHMDDDNLMLQIGPQERRHPLCLTLESQLRDVARQQLTDDLADETQREVLVSPALDGEIVLPPMSRNVLIYPLGTSPKFVIRKLGTGQLKLLSEVPLGETTAQVSVRLEFASEILPRYGVSELSLGSNGYLTASISDCQDGGTFVLCCEPGVTLDRDTWDSSVQALTDVHDQYIDSLLDWDERLRRGQLFTTADLQAVQLYGTALNARIGPHMRQQAALLSSTLEQRQQDALAKDQPGRVRDLPRGERDTVGAVLAQMLMFSFSGAFEDLSLAQWQHLLDGRDSPSMAGCLFGMYVDMTWQREQADEFYAGLAGLYAFLQMSTTDATVEAALERDEACLDAALDLIAGEPVSEEVLKQAGLAEIKDHPERLTRLKLILVMRCEERLFDDDPFWRDRLLHDLRWAHARSRRNNVFNLLSSFMVGRGGSDAVKLAYQHKKLSQSVKHPALPQTQPKQDVVLFDQVATMQIERGARAASPQRLSRSTERPGDDGVCRFVSAVNLSGALLIFIGDVGTALSKWYIGDTGTPRQRYTTMYFQILKAVGWGAQHAAGFACQPAADGPARFIQVTAPAVGLGMAFNYLAGGFAELVVRPPKTRWTWRRDMRPLVARIPGMRGNKIMQLVDLTGNIYLFVADGSRILELAAQGEHAERSEAISASMSCASSALGIATAAGEFGAKALLTPAKSFYQAVGISSALINLCGAMASVLPSGPLRADDEHGEL